MSVLVFEVPNANVLNFKDFLDLETLENDVQSNNLQHKMTIGQSALERCEIFM